MAPGNAGGGGRGGGNDYSDAKDLLDRIGEEVYKEVKSEADGTAEKYKGELEGNLKEAAILSELDGTYKPCDLVQKYYTKRLDDNGNPCKELSGKTFENPFSDTLGGQCTNEKMRSGGIGACAPYRRLHLCHHNLESINTNNYHSDNAKHKLLLEVCMAAKYEGNSIETYYTIHKQTNNDSAAELCTVLARSFADIGDIVRGRDLFHGNPQEKEKREQLENKLKDIFAKIYGGLKNGELKTRYKKDENGGNFFQLREDWWTANRSTVWKAITCDVKSGNNYFRQTCGDEKTGTLTPNKCRCDGDQVPTYFDYVPQYLRWFEEWAEDFCRLRKHKLENAIQKCRKGEDGKDKYCDLNRYDCTQTASGEKKFVEGKDCIGCHFSCSHFVKWIDNQKLEFEKQKKKYKSEISGGGSGRSRKRKKRSTKSDTYEGYEKNFYEQLEKNNYGTVDGFLELLNKEEVCTKELKDDDEEEGTINFKTVKSSSASGDGNKTFYRTTYCEACPWCGAEKDNTGNGKWKAKEQTCRKEKEYDEQNITDIPILTPEKGKLGIVKKYNKFCNGNGGNGAPGTANVGARGGKGEKSANGKKDDQIETWQCYYDDSINDGEQNDNCVEGEWKDFIEGKKVKPYNVFFWDWVHDMLHDSVEWKTELSKCINKDKGKTCKNSCKRPCECYERWVQQKEEEWTQIKDHFGKQKNILPVGDLAAIMTPDIVLKYVLQDGNLLQNIKDTHADANDIERIEALLDEEKQKSKAQAGAGGVTEQKSIIVELLQHEKDEADKCKQKQDQCKQAQDKDLGRTAGGPSATGPRANPTESDTVGAEDDEEQDENEENDDEDDEDGDDDANEEPAASEDRKEEKAKEGTVDGGPKEGPQQETTTTQINVCETVEDALTIDTLEKACPTKYGPKAPTSWKCIPTSGGNNTTTSGGVTPSGVTTTRGSEGSSGATCIPPRRRKLYVGKLEQWASGETTPQDGTSSQSGKVSSQEDGESRGSTSATASESPNGDSLLLTAFVESAAVETFFLWDRYKKEKKQPATQNGGLPLPRVEESPSEDDPEQKELQSGTIPNDFLRLMFYTLGDYRDICVGNTDIVVGDEKEKEKMNKIQQKIQEHINSGSKPGNSSPPGEKNPGQTTKPEEWWNDTLGPAVWNGMICALTYKENGARGPDGSQSLQQDTGLKTAFFGDKDNPGTPNGNPGLASVKPGTTGNTEGTYEKTYKYDQVKLEDTSGDVRTTNDDTKLENFVERPTFLRWLEEWGEEFCRKRTHKLKIIEKECKVEANSGPRGPKQKTPKCSCYGENCEDNLSEKYTTFPDFNCPSCANSCSSYRKWIERKKEEFDKQEKIYNRELESAKSNKNDNGFCVTGGKCNKAAEFLKTLASCKKDNGVGKPIFDEKGDAFKPATNCAPCPKFKINCKENGNCDNNKGENCNGKKTIDANDIETMGKPTEINMLVSDDNTNGNKFADLQACEKADIFNGFREDKWKCGNVCGYNVCKPKIVEGQENGKNQIIIIKAFFKIWLAYFLEDYNKIKKKLKPCMKKGEGFTCIKDYDKTYNCVKEWIEKKRTEWKNIKEHYETQNEGDDIKTFVKNILVGLYPQTDVKKATGRKNISDFESKVCNCTKSSETKGDNDANKKDIVECLLEKLGEKAEKCEQKHQNSDKTEKPCQESSPEPDDEPFEEEEDPDPDPNQKGKQHPPFCNIEDTPEQEDEDGCKAASPAPAPAPAPAPQPPAPAAPAAPPSEDPPATPPQKPRIKTHHVLDHPGVIPALVTSTLAWSVGIGFAAFTYFYLKVLYIYMYICGCICVLCISMCWYDWIYICVYVCVLYIFYIYLCIYIEKKKK